MSYSLQHKALLPTGFHDVLPPDASTRASIVSTLLDVFDGYGYERVMPPTLEFEESLFTGSGKALEHQTFRLMDPISRKMMGLRPDITMQVARIATTRLVNMPLPIRLSYSGQVFRVKSGDIHGERQTTQAGVELIGADSVLADAEVVRIAVDALHKIGVSDLSIDFNLPRLVTILLKDIALSDQKKVWLKQALNKKDAAAIAALAPEKKTANLLIDLVTPHGNSHDLLTHLLGLSLPQEARDLCQRLQDVIACLKQVLRGVSVTIDPLEHRGFEYHTGIGFAIFSKHYTGEIGRGGRYIISSSGGNDDQDTGAVGVTLYINDLYRLLPKLAAKPRIYVIPHTSQQEIHQLQEQGFVTICAIDAEADNRAKALRLKCQAIYNNGVVSTVSD